MAGIERRDFLNGMAIAITGFAAGACSPAAVYTESRADGTYPPAKDGLRGSHVGSFEDAHALRDGKSFDLDSAKLEEAFDLVVVGGGISGLAAAYFHHARNPEDRILVIDNHDDFGGHAKRNEYDVDGKLVIGYGGTQSIDSPRGRYSPEAMQLIRDLGIDIARFDTAFDTDFYKRNGAAGRAVFFPARDYGVDRLVKVERGDAEKMKAAIAQFPMSDEARAIITTLETSDRNPFPGKSAAETRELLGKISYADYIRQHWGATDEVVRFYMQRTHGLWCTGIDAVAASTGFGSGLPGSRGLAREEEKPADPNLPQDADGGHADEPYIYHFPDGNATIARLLVRKLVPGVAPGTTMDDIVLAKFDYDALDRSGQPVRIRLNSTGVKVRNVADGVEIGYVRGGKFAKIKAKGCVLACYNMMIPYMLEGLPEDQAAAMRMNVKGPLVYTNVVLRNWQAWQKLGVQAVTMPTGLFSSMSLDFPVSLEGYAFAANPNEPIVVHLQHAPSAPGSGLLMRDQFRMGRQKLYETSFADFEKALRDDMGAALKEGGFDFDRDVAAITVNRWAHGYAYTPDPLNDDDAEQEARMAAGRRPVGRVTIANSDAGWDAYTDVAIEEAHRAIGELAAMPRV